MAGESTIAGLILCGGRSTRMGGGDKCLLPLGGRPMLAHGIERAAAQTDALAISANGDPNRFDAFGLPVLPDTVPGFAGPLAGILAGLDWASSGRHHAMASFAGDTPFFPRDLVERLVAGRGKPGTIVVAASGGQRHNVFALWPVALADSLRRFLDQGESRGVAAFMTLHEIVTVSFESLMPRSGPVDPFFNINRPDDLAAAGRLAGDLVA